MVAASKLNLLSIFSVFIGVFIFIEATEAVADEGHNLSKWMDTIKNPNSMQADWDKAVDGLSKPPEPAKFWTDIANDPRYAVDRRRMAVLKLFERHIPPRTKLGSLGDLLAGAKWLEERDVDTYEGPSGLTGLGSHDPAVYSLVVLAKRDQKDFSWRIYLRTSKKIEPGDLSKALHGQKISPSLGEVKVLEYAFGGGRTKELMPQFILIRNAEGSAGESTKILKWP